MKVLPKNIVEEKHYRKYPKLIPDTKENAKFIDDAGYNNAISAYSNRTLADLSGKDTSNKVIASGMKSKRKELPTQVLSPGLFKRSRKF